MTKLDLNRENLFFGLKIPGLDCISSILFTGESALKCNGESLLMIGYSDWFHTSLHLRYQLCHHIVRHGEYIRIPALDDTMTSTLKI